MRTLARGSFGWSFARLAGRFGLAACVLALAAPLGAQGATPPSVPAAAPRVRPGRLVGVFDALSGEPLGDVTITNTLNGLSSRTTATGTVTLFFVDTTGGLIRVQKVGYQPQTLFVGNSDRDTIPLTIVLETAGQRLNTVVTTAKRSPADTVRALELNGFYERRATSGAPASAFQSGERIERLTLLSDINALSGRSVCTSNMYLNGVRIPEPEVRVGKGRVMRNLKSNPLDQIVDAHDVLAVELYRDGEVPAAYNMTRAPGKPSCGATLIWTK